MRSAPPLTNSWIRACVIMYQDRILVPRTLRSRILHHLHAAHQGISAMEQRARAIVYWPGMTVDISTTRETCNECNRNAPSQAATPPIPSSAPSTLFESVFADFFRLWRASSIHPVVGDRLSGWEEVYASSSGTRLSAANGFIKHLRSFFATFGVPADLSSDGGPEFSAGCTEDFLKKWVLHHRISSTSLNQMAERRLQLKRRSILSPIPGHLVACITTSFYVQCINWETLQTQTAISRQPK